VGPKVENHPRLCKNPQRNWRFVNERLSCTRIRGEAAAMTTQSENDADARVSSEEEEILSMKFGGRTIRENLEAAITAGHVIRLPDGKLSLPETAPAMQFINKGTFDRDCAFLNRFMFSNVYSKSSVPLGCAACYKVKVETQTMRQLMAVKKIADGFDYRAKSGAEVDRPDNQSLYSTYFYLTGLDQAREVYKQVRAKVDADPALGPSIKVIIKRGCTNYEHACGPSNRYTFDPRLEAVEVYFRKRYAPPKRPPMPARKYRDASTLLETASIAFRIGDNTYKDFTGGQEVFPPTVSYDPDGTDDESSN
jgi:hypothetical protein